MSPVLRQELSGLAANLLNGARLMVFRPMEARFHYSLHQVVMLLVVGVLVSGFAEYLRYLPDPQFNLHALSGETLALAGVLFVAYLVSVAMRDTNAGLRFLVHVYSAAPFMYGVSTLFLYVRALGPLSGMVAQWALYVLGALWVFAVVAFILHRVSGRRGRRTAAYLASYIAVVVAPTFYIYAGEFWYPRVDRAAASAPSPFDKINQENLYYAQPALLDAATRALAPGRPGIVDLYFVGFGSYAGEDVFMKEVRFAQSVFDERFDTRGRSIALINNPATIRDVPLASASNLKKALKRIGRIMNRDEDILFLFMTSHGSKEELSVSFRRMDLNDIKPADLKAALDEAGIKWRVLMISACYSGSFIESLKDKHALIATASAPDKKSFGCGSESDFTYFGKAVLDEQLKIERHFPTAFARAAESIKAREKAEKKEPSDPRLFVGEAIAPKLRELEKRLNQGMTAAAE